MQTGDYTAGVGTWDAGRIVKFLQRESRNGFCDSSLATQAKAVAALVVDSLNQ
jgi:hypothetical protein